MSPHKKVAFSLFIVAQNLNDKWFNEYKLINRWINIKNYLTSLHLVFYVHSIEKFTKRTDLGRATAPLKAKEKDEEGRGEKCFPGVL